MIDRIRWQFRFNAKENLAQTVLLAYLGCAVCGIAFIFTAIKIAVSYTAFNKNAAQLNLEEIDPLFTNLIIFALLFILTSVAAAVLHVRAIRFSEATGIGRSGFKIGLTQEILLLRERFFSALRKIVFLGKSHSSSFELAIELLVLLAKSDGRMSKAEARFVDDYVSRLFRNNTAKKVEILKAMRSEIKRKPSVVAADYCKLSRNSLGMREHLFSMLLAVANLDGPPNENEKNFLEEVARALKLRPEDLKRAHAQMAFEKLRSEVRNNQPEFETFENEAFEQNHQSRAKEDLRPQDPLYLAYEILECSPQDSIKKIKSAYRKLALRHHPDRLKAQGLSSEMLSQASARFRSINEAYSLIFENRKREKNETS